MRDPGPGVSNPPLPLQCWPPLDVMSKQGFRQSQARQRQKTVKPVARAIGPGPGCQELAARAFKEYGRTSPPSNQENEGSVI